MDQRKLAVKQGAQRGVRGKTTRTDSVMNDIIFTSAAATEGRLPRLRTLFWTVAGSYAGLYAGRISRSWIRFARLDMPLPNLGATLEGAKLVHISDLHCSPIVMEGYLRQIIHHINAENPDFVAITGDLVTGGTHYAKRVARLLGELKATEARVACLGNHDFGIYHPRGHGHMRQLPGYLSRRLFDAGVHTLRNQHAIFRRGPDAIQFVGVDDMWSDGYSPDAAFAEAPKGLPTIALAHNPDSPPHDLTWRPLGAQRPHARQRRRRQPPARCGLPRREDALPRGILRGRWGTPVCQPRPLLCVPAATQ